MRIVHRISERVDSRIRREFARAGVEVGEGFVTFEICESDARWPQVAALLERLQSLTLVRTEFTERERRDAKWLAMSSTWLHGYPMPDEDNGYMEMTYDPTRCCGKCGLGLVQRAPFRMAREPRWGRRHVLQLNWVFDQYFVKPEVWQAVFRKYGIECMPVIHNRTGQELKSVVQLQIDVVAPERLVVKEERCNTCPACGVPKYEPHTRGKFPGFASEVVGPHALKTQEIWGSGHRAFGEVLVSQELYGAIAAARLRGVRFEPLAR